MMSKTRCPEPGEIWMGNFKLLSDFKPLLLGLIDSTLNPSKKKIILIISKTKERALDTGRAWPRGRQTAHLALGLCEGKIVGIEDVDISDPCIGLTRIA